MRRDDRTEAHPRHEVSIGRQLLVRRRNRQASDPELAREGADTRQSLTRPKATRVDRIPDVRLDLAVERLGARPIELEWHRG
jgi:hypothetical protein